jgi:hypothetical protein
MFVLHLHTCNLGTEERESANPFTGERIGIPIDSGLTSTERLAVKSLLTTSGATAPDPDTYCRVALPDGSIINLAVGNLFTDNPCIAFALEYDTLTPDVVSFIHALASRGNMAIGSSTDPTVVALPLSEQRNRVLSRWPQVHVVESPLDLEDWIRHHIH